MLHDPTITQDVQLSSTSIELDSTLNTVISMHVGLNVLHRIWVVLRFNPEILLKYFYSWRPYKLVLARLQKVHNIKRG